MMKLADYKTRYHYLFLLMTFILMSCNASDDIDIHQVDDSILISETELQKLQQQKQPIQNRETFYFGFDLRASPQEDAAQYIPFLDYLEQVTGYNFKLHFTSKNSSTVEDLGQNRIQFAAMGATSYLKAQSRYGAVSLVRGLNKQGKAEYQSVFVVKPESKISTIKDIRNRVLAFGNRNSTQGHLIPRIVLIEHGILFEDLKQYDFTGSHQNCAEAVISGKFDVCGMQDQLAQALASQGLLKIIHKSRYYPSSGIVASKSVPDKVVMGVKKALLNFDPQGKHSQRLYNWDRTEMPNGFVDAMDSDYVDLRAWSTRLGFL